MINGKRLTVVEIKNLKKLMIMLRLISPTISLENNVYKLAYTRARYEIHYQSQRIFV